MTTYLPAEAAPLIEFARLLDSFPRLTQEQRAEIFHAYDVAPEAAPITFDECEDYMASPARRAWARIRDYKLSEPRQTVYALTLEEASGYSGTITKSELLATLARAERMLA